MIDQNARVDNLILSFKLNTISENNQFGYTHKTVFNSEYINSHKQDNGTFEFNDSLYFFECSETHKASYSQHFKVFYKTHQQSLHIGFFHTDGIKNMDYCLFKFANQFHYDHRYRHLSYDFFIRYFQDLFKLTMVDVRAIDIAIDTQVDIHLTGLQTIEYSSNAPRFIQYRKRGITKSYKYESFTESTRLNDTDGSVYIGSSDSGKQICIYNKSDENIINPKAHIKSYLMLFTPLKPVYRAELRLTNKMCKGSNKLMDKVDVLLLNNPDYLTNLFIELCGNLTRFKYLKRKKKKNKFGKEVHQTFDILDELNLQTKPVNILERNETVIVENEEPKSSKTININKSHFKKMVQVHLTGNEDYLNEILETVRNKDLTRHATIQRLYDIGKLDENKFIAIATIRGLPMINYDNSQVDDIIEKILQLTPLGVTA